MTPLNRLFHCENSYESTRRDKPRRWLWRLVRRLGKCGNARDQSLGAASEYCRHPSHQIYHDGKTRRVEVHFFSAWRAISTFNFNLQRRSRCEHLSSSGEAARERARSSGVIYTVTTRCLMPNVKDEPRAERARRVRQKEFRSDVSFRCAFGSTRRDRSARWLWCLVSPFFHLRWVHGLNRETSRCSHHRL
jgi:hypothetical protein